MNARAPIVGLLVAIGLLSTACGGSDAEEAAPPASLPAPSTSEPARVEADEPPTSLAPTEDADDSPSPCDLWTSTVETLLTGGSYADQTAATERWLESVHTSADSPVVGLPLVDFRASAEALAAAGWEFAAVDDGVLLGWVEGMLGNTLFGVGQPPVPRDDCDIDLRGPEAAAVSIDCAVRLEPGNSWLVDLDRDPTVELTEAEADALSAQVAHRWIDAGASPLCVSQVLGSVPSEDIQTHMATLSAEDVNQVALAGAALSDVVYELDYFAPTRFVEIDGAIP